MFAIGAFGINFPNLAVRLVEMHTTEMPNEEEVDQIRQIYLIRIQGEGERTGAARLALVLLAAMALLRNLRSCKA